MYKTAEEISRIVLEKLAGPTPYEAGKLLTGKAIQMAQKKGPWHHRLWDKFLTRDITRAQDTMKQVQKQYPRTTTRAAVPPPPQEHVKVPAWIEKLSPDRYVDMAEEGMLKGFKKVFPSVKW